MNRKGIKSVNLRVCVGFEREVKKIKKAFADKGLTISDSQATEYYFNMNKQGGTLTDKTLLKGFDVIIKKR